MHVPFMDLAWQIAQTRQELDEAIRDCIANTAFVQGERVEAFEDEFARFCGSDHAIGCGSGTDALYLALKALGIGRGDEVIVPTMTFIATAEAVDMVGATTVLVDVEPATGTLDPRATADAITDRTRAIVPVHLYGHPARLGELGQLATGASIPIVADAAQAHGAEYGGRPISSLAKVTCFSFYPGKNLGAFGDAGGCTTDDDALARDMRMRRNHGREDKYRHEFSGVNMRMDELQGAVLRVKLARLTDWTNRRREVARKYDEGLSGIAGLQLPAVAPEAKAVWHLYVVECDERDALASHLRARGIQTGVHYPIPLHLQPAYKQMGLGIGSFPVAEAKAQRVLSLPMFEGLSDAQVLAIIDAVSSFFSR